jgi:outer membrane protein TolC
MKRAINQTASAKAHMLEAEAMAKSMTNMVRKMVAMEFIETQTHLTLARKIGDEILPAAQAALTSTREQYAAGRGDFLRLLEANRAWTGAHIEYEEQLYHTLEHRSELERWVGVDFSTVPKEAIHEK